MKRIASLLLVLLLVLCGCSELYTNDNSLENTYSGSGIVAGEQEIPEKEMQLKKSDSSKEEYENSAENAETSSLPVYRTRSGEKYHREGCYYLKSKIETTVDVAKSMGLKPCSKCHPPQ